jgi:serine/threonine protein kinase
LQPEFIRKIYSLLQLYEKALCQNADISYPARFKVKAIYQPCSEQTSFDLEIHTNRKASLIFQETKKTWIETGTTKIVLGAYTLGKPKKIAYLMSRSQSHTKDNANNEEKYFTLLKGEPYIAKVYGIFYYPFSGTYRKDPQQIIEMKYYSRDLFKLLRSPDYSKLSDQKKINYSRQLIEAIDQLHQKKILHRDIKLENILVSDQKGLKITDFGLACQQDDPNLSTQRVGSMSSVSPEIIRDEIDPNPDGQARDIWSAGCVLWLLWYPNSLYPWYEEIGELYPDSEIILHAMRNFDSCKIDPSQKLPFLIWNMLRYEAHLRWKPTQILEALKSIADHLSANSSTSNLTEQFPMPK